LRENGIVRSEVKQLVDSEAAAVILRDFLETGQHRMLVPRSENTA
jgi:hypothetical protein